VINGTVTTTLILLKIEKWEKGVEMDISQSAAVTIVCLVFGGIFFGIPAALIVNKLKGKLPTDNIVCPKCGKAMVKGKKITLDHVGGQKLTGSLGISVVVSIY
jgi:hypothetical protein